MVVKVVRETHSLPLFQTQTHLHFALLTSVKHTSVLKKTGTHSHSAYIPGPQPIYTETVQKSEIITQALQKLKSVLWYFGPFFCCMIVRCIYLSLSPRIQF